MKKVASRNKGTHQAQHNKGKRVPLQKHIKGHTSNRDRLMLVAKKMTSC